MGPYKTLALDLGLCYSSQMQKLSSDLGHVCNSLVFDLDTLADGIDFSAGQGEDPIFTLMTAVDELRTLANAYEAEINQYNVESVS